MRAAQIRRHLGASTSQLPRTGTEHGLPQNPNLLFGVTADGATTSQAPLLNLEFSPRDYIAYLLSIDAEIEHCLMVQYLYAAYSLGGPQVPQAYRDVVRNWQEVILGIAKEEMGHLISVQNSLRLIGAPLHLEREDTPWDVPFYPFPFMLEPLTLDSLAKYVYAESPVGWDGGELGDEIRLRVHAQTSTPHQVSELFNTLIPLVADPDYLPDDAFDPATYPAQADFAEWGRGYQGGQRGNTGGVRPAQTPDVLVKPQTCRDDMVEALKAIAEQGEATTGAVASHFVRFLRIYVEMRELTEQVPLHAGEWEAARPTGYTDDKWRSVQPHSKISLQGGVRHAAHWAPARKVAINPYVSLDPDLEPELGGGATRITDPQSALWATLLNLRYRMLLTYLIHSFTLYGGLNAAGLITPRGTIVNATFGEMYNLRAISDILTQSPLSATDPDAGYAGPPFQMPYTLNSPFGEKNRWRGHLDLLTAAESLVEALLLVAPPSRHAYLASMRESDQNMKQLARRILSGSIDTALI
ncbi:ferritin-like domain-containing protein [Janthinobacterium agaricidamnosum]|uniref:Iminophenyl-pyruvate dimer synthase domain-containing protein n=1 Tax=Janthinobacterium agaricidamnosum NBRC 102515 = DSM 9628 TaxID=1349767 RepID=W0V8B5_9BURK|nr:ferritin-like domain-containing protein [Janthinobacterium agaricidamnosum]CDG83588.1 putative uncharacterized protein [Janthinobacterium agaricidamnosum NBRC 102515 = DSM 9628]